MASVMGIESYHHRGFSPIISEPVICSLIITLHRYHIHWHSQSSNNS
jgi:hypothetical protein